MNTKQLITRTVVTFAALTIAGVSLLLGGLGVANMMVISVTERSAPGTCTRP